MGWVISGIVEGMPLRRISSPLALAASVFGAVALAAEVLDLGAGHQHERRAEDQ